MNCTYFLISFHTHIHSSPYPFSHIYYHTIFQNLTSKLKILKETRCKCYMTQHLCVLHKKAVAVAASTCGENCFLSYFWPSHQKHWSRKQKFWPCTFQIRTIYNFGDNSLIFLKFCVIVLIFFCFNILFLLTKHVTYNNH